MAISLADLPEKYKAQAVRKWQQMQKRKKKPFEAPEPTYHLPVPPPPMPSPLSSPTASKYHAQPVDIGKLHFDSRKEARRFETLELMQRAGEIKELRLQVDFTLQEAYTTTDGQRIRAIRYRADFTYKRKTAPDATGQVYWLPVVEDVKSRATKTKGYMIKRKLMAEKFSIDIQEV